VNGTFINGKRIEAGKEEEIKLNDIVVLGQSNKYFKIEGKN
jgi:pSer/pThr/pTyr-binding forkhead associated (FHA) protein